MSDQRELDIVVYGASGYTGRLVAEYLGRLYGPGNDLTWALAGRSMPRLQAVRDELGLSPDIPLIEADASEPASLQAMVTRTQVVLTTVGPYQLYGNELLAACANSGTDYVDLCGEPAWMRQMIDAHESAARASGARIVFSCGFDSIPFDLGVYSLQQAALEKTGSPLSRVRGRVKSMRGGWSGGTLASFRATMAAAAEDPGLQQTLINPFALTPGYEGAEQPSGTVPVYEDMLQSWAAPFVMAIINTKNIHRSNLLLGHPYGEDFAYDEMLLTGPGDKGEAMAKALAADKSMASDPTKQGEGPSREERENGFYDLLFIGQTEDGERLTVNVKGDMDPGYGSTSKIVSEAAAWLALNPGSGTGGIFTPAAAMGQGVIDRLQQNAGLTFTLSKDR